MAICCGVVELPVVQVSMFRLLLLVILWCFTGALPVNSNGLSFEHRLNLKITESYVSVADVHTNTCSQYAGEIVHAAKSVRWTNVLKKFFMLEIPFKSTAKEAQFYVEVEAIFDAKPYFFQEKRLHSQSPLRVLIKSPPDIEQAKPIWVIAKVSLNNCVFADVYTRLSIE